MSECWRIALSDSLHRCERGPARQHVRANRVDVLGSKPPLERRHSLALVFSFQNDLAILVESRRVRVTKIRRRSSARSAEPMADSAPLSKQNRARLDRLLRRGHSDRSYGPFLRY